MNKKGLSFKLMFFGMIVASVLIIAVGSWLNDWGIDYNSDVVYDLDDYNRLDDVATEAGQQKSGITVKSASTGEDFEGTSIKGVFGILNNMYDSVRIITGDGGVIDSVFNKYGIPDYLKLALISMITIAITFTLVAIFFRLTRRDV